MKKLGVWSLIFSLICQTFPIPLNAETEPAKSKSYVAVMDFEVSEGIPKNIGVLISDQVREALLNTDKYILIDRGNIQMILSEQAFAQTGFCDQSCAIQVGRALSAHLIITGRVIQVSANECRVNGQITDVERTDIVRSVSESCECSGNEILAASETVAFALAGVLANRGTLVIHSAPKTAIVYIDGEKKGNTPISVKVKPGQHKVIVAAKDYRMEERTLTIAPAATVSINFQLKKEMRKWYQAWWFYGVVGVAAAGGVAAIIAGSAGSGGGGGGGTNKSPPTGSVIIDSGSP